MIAPPPARTERRRSTMRPVDLPAEVLRVLKLIAADMRDVPREIVRDPAELFVWLRRMAARIEGIERILVPATDHVRPGSTPGPRILPVGGFSGVPRYPGSAAGLKSPSLARKSGLRTITPHKGKPIPVEVRQITPWS